jgi:hypothetical protein
MLFCIQFSLLSTNWIASYISHWFTQVFLFCYCLLLTNVWSYNQVRACFSLLLIECKCSISREHLYSHSWGSPLLDQRYMSSNYPCTVYFVPRFYEFTGYIRGKSIPYDANELLGSQSLRLVRWNAINYYIYAHNKSLFIIWKTTLHYFFVRCDLPSESLWSVLFFRHALFTPWAFVPGLIFLPPPPPKASLWMDCDWLYCNLTSQKVRPVNYHLFQFNVTLIDPKHTLLFFTRRSYPKKKKKQRVDLAETLFFLKIIFLHHS